MKSLKSLKVLGTTLALAVAFVAAFSLSADSAFALGGGGRCGGGVEGRGLDRMEQKIDQLDLSSDTRQAVFGILDEARESRRGLSQELRSSRDQMHELLAADSPDEAAVMQQADALAALQLEARKARLKSMLDLRALLTAEQWEAIQPKHRGRGRGGRDQTER